MLHGQAMQFENMVLADVAAVATQDIPLAVLAGNQRDFKITEETVPRKADVAAACCADDNALLGIAAQFDFTVEIDKREIQAVFLYIHSGVPLRCQ